MENGTRRFCEEDSGWHTPFYVIKVSLPHHITDKCQEEGGKKK
jgi:hypothetical protein